MRQEQHEQHGKQGQQPRKSPQISHILMRIYREQKTSELKVSAHTRNSA
jgi:hypothetical protein